jgi:hypothetical protein
MDAKLKADWVKALRSGEYRQARGALQDKTGALCCLGVLCKVAGLEIRKDGKGVVGADDSSNIALYEPIFDLVGGHSNSHPLSMRNDGAIDNRQHTFPEIADYIEANL